MIVHLPRDLVDIVAPIATACGLTVEALLVCVLRAYATASTQARDCCADAALLSGVCCAPSHTPPRHTAMCDATFLTRRALDGVFLPRKE